MIKLLIVAGSQTESLSDYIDKTSGGSVSIDYKFNSFGYDFEELSSTIVRADKLIYVISDNIDIRKELVNLYNLMTVQAFFKVGEIHLFVKSNDVLNETISNFQSIMSDLEFSNYKINTINGEISFTDIYKDVLGIVTEDGGQITKYKKVYRAVRNEQSKVGYDPTFIRKNIVPVEENSAEVYEKVKEASVKSETGKVIRDADAEEIPKIDLTSLVNIDVSSRMHKQNIVIVVGNPKSGTSSFCSHLCMSLSNKVKTYLVDLSRNCGSARTVIRKSDKYTLVDNRELLLGTEYNNLDLAVFNTATIKDRHIKLDYLKHLLSIPNRVRGDYYILDLDMDNLDDVLSLCDKRIHSIYFVSQEIHDELSLIKHKVNSLSDRYTSYLYLNNSIQFDSSFKRVESVSVKETIHNCKIIKPINFNKRVDLSVLFEG